MYERRLLTTLVALLYLVQPGQGACDPSSCTTCSKSVSPRYGSTQGGIYLTVTGEGFVLVSGQSTDPDEGTRIKLVCKDYSYDCDVQQDVSTTVKMVCITYKMPQADAPCRAFVYNDGVQVPEVCISSNHYNARDDRTPTQEGVEPIFGPRNSLLTLKGKTFTDITDSTQMSSTSRAFRRVYAGNHLATELDMKEYNAGSHQGKLQFRDNSPTYGCHCVKYIISQDTNGYGGRSKTSDSIMMWSDEEKPYCYQTYPVITAITPSMSSIAGGTRITLWGVSLIDIADAVVKAGGETCQVVESTNDYLVCLTPPQPTSSQCDFYPGNRGIIWKIYDGADIDATKLNETKWSDFFGFVDTDGRDHYSTEFIGCFKPPKDLEYVFTQSSDDLGETYFNPIPCNNTELLIIETTHSKEKEYAAGQLDSQECYYLRGRHREGTGASDFHLGLYIAETTATKNNVPSHFVHEEVQIVHACGTRNKEIWEFELPRSQIEFTYGGKTTEKHSFNLPQTPQADREKMLRDIFYDLLSCHCPTLNAGIVYSTSYEYNSAASGNYDHRSLNWHALHSEDEPLCGHVSMKNPYWVYRYNYDGPHNTEATHIKLGTGNGEVQSACVGGRGSFDKIYVVVRLYHSNGRLAHGDQWWDITAQINLAFTSTWDFYCFNMYTAIMADSGRAGRVSGLTIKLRHIVFEKKKDANIHYFIDYVHIGDYNANQKDKVMQDRNCVKPGGQMVDTISVEETDETTTTRSFKMSLDVYHCAVNLVLPTISSNQASVTSTQSTNRAATGTFKLCLAGSCTPATSIDVSAKDLQDTINSHLPVTGVVVYEWSWHCWRPHYNIYFKAMPGNQVQMTVNDSTVSCFTADQGINIYTWQEGGIWMEDIYETFMRTMHSDPQVTLEYKGNCRVPAKCGMADGNCPISWHASVTPEITAVNPTQGKAGTEITVTGSNMQENTTDTGDLSAVTVNGQSCAPLLVRGDTEIVCTMGPCGRGSHKVNVHIRGKGDAKHPSGGNVMFACTSAATTITPASSGAQGGYRATIAGHGFDAQSGVTIGGNVCTITDVTYTQIQCDVPAGSVGAAEVIVTHTGGDTDPISFGYLTATDAKLLSSSPGQLGVIGGTATITGENFPASVSMNDITVTVDGVAATVMLYDSTTNELTITAPALSPGIKNVQVSFGSLGFADANSLTLTYVLHVTSVCPERGSYAGGTSITITGSGFTNTSVVTIGGVPCTMDTQTDTQIVCITGPIQKTWVVTNDGSHPVYGIGYAWFPPSSNLKEGDKISWDWDMNRPTPDRVMCPGNTDTDLSLVYASSGFKCPQAVPKGTFEWTFPNTGSWNYWSGYIDVSVNSIYARGTVTVSARTSETFPVVVTVAGHTAPYNTQGAASCTTQDTSSCVDTPPAGNAAEVSFSYAKCSTPVITAISPTQDVRPGATIVFTMTGGTTDPSEVTVTVCDKSCQVTAATTTSITCTIQHQDNLGVNQQCPVSVMIGDFGSAYFKIANAEDKSLQIRPGITSVSPKQGSIHGCTQVTISGIGFESMLLPTVHWLTQAETESVQCDVSSWTYTEIQCETRSGDGTFPVLKVLTVPAQTNPAVLTIVCTTASCKFESKSTITPTVTTYQTPIDASPYDWALTGTNFKPSVNTAVLEIWHAKYSKAQTPNCTYSQMTNTQLTCTLVDLHQEKDDYSFRLITTHGCTVTHTINALAAITSITPTTSNKCGGLTLTINGAGFPCEDAEVRIQNTICPITSCTSIRVECTLPSKSGTHAVNLKFFGTTVTATDQFVFDNALAVTVTAISITEGKGGDQLTLTGTSLGTTVSDVTVTIGAVQTVNAVTDTSIDVTLVHYAAGLYNVAVIIANKGCGTQTTQLTFTYTLVVTSFSPLEGSFGGGQEVTTAGTGFKQGDTVVTLCGLSAVVDVTSPTSLTFTTPLVTDRSGVTNGELACTVTISVGSGFIENATSLYTYKDSLTPTITSISPTRGGTGGNTLITIGGTGFGAVQDPGTVNILGVGLCAGSITWTDTLIMCNVPAPPSSMETFVVVSTANGISQQSSTSAFWYIDVWSSPFTWGGRAPPGNQAFIVVNAARCILIDVDTAVLTMLLIDGGCILFDRSKAHLTLSAENIMIINNGSLEIGTEENPYCPNRVTIKMYGQLRAKELPIYGAKALAVRHGILCIYGCIIPTTWTRLSQDAPAGSTTVTVDPPALGWKVGDTIVFPTTGDHLSMSENEVHTISAISSDKRTLTIDPLEAAKLGHVETVGGQDFPMRGEVGLLTRNIVFMGTGDPAWEVDIPACPAGFDPGEFATQTCFQGRFGDEVGSDQFGGHILMHNPVMNSMLAVAKLAFLEVTYVGQAFRLGRYPIHFHLNGDMTGSYVRGCSIHNTFNRAINIHGSHNLLIEHNVVYNVMGGALFLEDGVETGNTFQYNLVVFVKASTSLLNDDITPAAFWVTNADNTYRHNCAAGGTHFAWWYRMHEHPDGASASLNVLPQKVTVRTFFNNTAHSQGWFGIWIFQDYHPLTPAIYDLFYVWNCEKGAEWVNAGRIQFKRFYLYNNKVAQLEHKFQASQVNSEMFTHDGSVVSDSWLINYVGSTPPTARRVGAVLPMKSGILYENVTFARCSGGAVAIAHTHVQGTCSDHCSGFIHKMVDIHWVDSPNKADFETKHQAALWDEDGSFTGTGIEGYILPKLANLPASCSDYDGGYSASVPLSVCDAQSYLIRFSFNSFEPHSNWFKDACFVNDEGTFCAPFMFKRVTHGNGWAVFLVAAGAITAGTPVRERYQMSILEGATTTYIKYTGTFYRIPKGVCLEIGFPLKELPDRVKFGGSWIYNASTSLDDTYDWVYESGHLVYIVCGPSTDGVHDVEVNLHAEKCEYTGCVEPDGDDSVSVYTACLGTTAATWDESKTDWTSTQDAVIAADKCVTITVSGTYTLNSLVILGTLEIANTAAIVVVIKVNYVLVKGGYFIAGTTANTFKGKFTLLMMGHQYDDPKFTYETFDVQVKTMLVHGGMEFHGELKSTCTKLTQTVDVGDTELFLLDDVDWVDGDEIFLTTTGFEVTRGEMAIVDSVQNNKVTIKTGVSYEHLGSTHVLTAAGVSPTKEVKTRGEVCSWNRNIIISGEDTGYTDTDEVFGFAVIVSKGVLASGNGIKGYARLSSVEFVAGGQEGAMLRQHYGACALNFVDLEETNTAVTLPDWVKHSAYHHNRGVGICVIDSSKVQIENVFLYRVKPTGIYIAAAFVSVDRAVVTYALWPGSSGNSITNYEFNAAFNVEYATNLRLTNSIGSAFERSCMKLPYNPCSNNAYDAMDWTGNECHGGLIGFERYIKPNSQSEPCMEVPNFFAWHCWDFGIFMEVKSAIQVKNVIGVNNGVSLFLMVITPSALSHSQNLCNANTKKIIVKDSTLVGRTTDSTCAATNGDQGVSYFFKNRGLNKGPRRLTSGYLGLVVQFSGGHNSGADHPIAGIMSYNMVCGLTQIQNMLFSHFNNRCSRRDAIIGINQFNEDLTHPFHVQGTEFGVAVDESSKFWNPEPSVGKVNPSDCVDMTCDGKMKNLVKDLDGSFFENNPFCSAISDSAFEWDGDARYGLGSYRIPSVAHTDLNGNRLDVDVVFPNKGIFRNNACVRKPEWQAYFCCDLEYFLLVLESLDEDTELRRLSPIALAGSSVPNGGEDAASRPYTWMDLVNGPQDHGWCAGYTCQKRISTFHFMVAADYYFDMYLTSTPPQRMRLQMLNSGAHHCIRLAVYYSTPSRLDVFHNLQYVTPATGPIVLGTNPVSGANYLDKARNLLNIIICGQNIVMVYIAPIVKVTLSMPAMSTAEFYGTNVAANLAAFLGVPQANIYVTLITADPNGKRRKRATETMEVAVTIESPPTSPDDADAEAEQTQAAGSAIVSAIQLGTIDDAANSTVLGATVQQPPPQPGSEAWAEYAADENAGQPVTIQTPTSAVSLQAPDPSHEGAPFTVYPAIRLLDLQGSPIELLGTVAVPWRMKAELVLGSGSDLQAVLWDNEVSFYKGWANFTKLSISHSGSGYGLRFYVSYPAEASTVTNLQVSVSDLTVAEAVFKTQFRQLPAEILPTDSFKVSVDVLDSVTNMLPKNISWKGHMFRATISIDPRTGYPGSLSPASELQMDLSNEGTAMTGNLRLDSVGRMILSVSVVSTPADFSMTASSSAIDVNQVLFASQSSKGMSEAMMRFPGLSGLAENLLPFFLAAVQNKFSPVYKDVTFNNFTSSENELNFVVWGREPEIKKATDAIWDRILEGLKISSGGKSYEADAYMLMDGNERVGEKKKDSGNLAAIIAGSIIGVILVIVIVAVLAWFFLKGKPKSAVEPAKATEANAESVEKGAAGSKSKADKGANGKTDRKAEEGNVNNADKAEVEDIVEDME